MVFLGRGIFGVGVDVGAVAVAVVIAAALIVFAIAIAIAIGLAAILSVLLTAAKSSHSPDFFPRLPRSDRACDAAEKRDQGGALFERNAVERVCADPRFSAAAQVARSEAQGLGQPGRFFFGDFLLAKQKKVTRRRATPGQPLPAKSAKTPTLKEVISLSCPLNPNP